MAEKNKNSVMIMAGEASGDMHGARLVRAMTEKRPDLFFMGMGGPALEEERVKLFLDASRVSVVGITEVAARLPDIYQGLGMAREMLHILKPSLLILIDFPDFNFRVAKAAKKAGVRVLYYICPQVWAWRKYRVKFLEKFVDHVAVILPFEKDFYEEHGVRASFVGHPSLDDPRWQAREPEEQDSPPLVGLVPGSRTQEVTRHLPLMLEAARIIKDKFPAARFALPLAPTISRELVEGIIREAGEKIPEVEVCPKAVDQVLARAAVSVTVSGTVTLEAALCAAPMVIIYAASRTSYWIAKSLVRLDFVGLPNLIAEKAVVPELIQGQARPENIAAHVLDILENPEKQARMRQELKKVRARLGKPGASERAGDIALKMLDGDL